MKQDTEDCKAMLPVRKELIHSQNMKQDTEDCKAMLPARKEPDTQPEYETGY
jgi:hypothetical protein